MRNLLFILIFFFAGPMYGQSMESPGFGAIRQNQSAIYQVRFTTRVKTDFRMFGNIKKDTSLSGTFGGEMQIVCSQVTDSGNIFYCRFRTIDQVDLPLPRHILKSVQSDLLKGCLFLERKNGLINRIYFPDSLSETGEFIFVQLLERYQYFFPRKKETRWQSAIQTNDGNMEAGYELISSKKEITELRLVALKPVEADLPQQMIVKSNEYNVNVLYAVKNKSGWLQNIKGSVERHSRINNNTMTVQTDSFEFNLVSNTPLKEKNHFPDLLPGGGKIYSRPLYYPEKIIVKAREKDISKSKEISISVIMQQLNENETRKEEVVKDNLTEAIRVCLVSGKDSIYLIKNAFFDAETNGFTFKTIRAALVISSTEYAQEVLCLFMKANQDDWNKLKLIIPAAGLVRNPTRKLQQQLELFAFDSSLSEKIYSAAQLALGNMAGSLRFTDSVRAGAIALQLAIFLKGSPDVFQVISVLGNCGTSNILPYILPFLDDTVISVKAYGYYALRFISDPEVEETYQRALKEDQDNMVLENIFNALYFRKFSQDTYGQVKKIIQDHPSERIRLQALQLVSGWAYNHSELVHDIEIIASNNSMKPVRDSAVQFLKKNQ